MGRASFAKTSFTSGALGPRVSRRVDTQSYFNGAKTLENFIVLPWGGIERTPGTVFVAEVRDSSKPARLLDFVFNRRQAYLLQLNDSKIRFYKNKGIVSGSGTGALISDITNASPGVVTTVAHHGLENGDIVILSDVDGMEEVNGVEYTVANKTDHTFELTGIDTSDYGTFIPSTATVLLLHLNSNFNDSSSVTPNTVTPVGGAAISTAQSAFGGGSCLFDGAGDYLSILDNADFDFSGGTFTIDCWIRPTDLSSIRTIFQQGTGAGDKCQFFVNTDGSLEFAVTAASSVVVDVKTAASVIAVDTWYHVALMENGNTWTLFVNGGLAATSTDAQRCANYTGNVYIGIDYDGSSSAFQGYIDEFRITAGVARFVSDVDSYTKLLLHMNGADASTTFTDEASHTMTAVDNAQIDTAQSVFGGASGKLDGTGDYITTPDSADFDFGSGDWTLEARIRLSATGSYALFGKTSGTSGWKLGGSTNYLYMYSGGGSYVPVAWTASANTWYHVAVVRSGNDIKFFIDGTQVGATQVAAATYNGGATTLCIGHDGDGTYTDLNGWMDEVRISKGIARWTANFTSSTGEYGGTADLPTHEGFAKNAAGGVYEIDHAYDDDEIFDIQTSQSADIEYLFHPDHPVMKLSRFDDDDWTLEEVEWEDGPYLDENATTTTLDPNGTTGSVIVTASAVTGINDGQGFLITDIGRLISFHDGTDYHYLKITDVTNTTHAVATVKGADMGGHTATAKWSLGAWSGTTGYPRTGTFHQGRLWAAATNWQPQTIWASVSEDFENMKAGSNDADAIIASIMTDRVNLINWIASEKRLVVGTSQELFTVFSGALSEPITPANIQVDPSSSFGSSEVPPEKIGSFLYYFEGDDRRLRELSYTVVSETFNAANKTILSDHITSGGVIETAFQQSPYGIEYCVRGDGKMATFTREADQQIEAWTEQVPAGTDAAYKSVAVIPVDGYDEVWFIVSRTIDSGTKQYVEYQINPRQQEEADLEDMVLMQSALQRDSSLTSTVSGLEHLEGEAVVAICDGVEVSGTVSGGSLALGASYSVISVGLGVVSKCKLLPPEAASAIGSAQGLMKRINEVLVSVYRSLGLQAGEDGGNMEEVLRDGNGALPTTLQTDDFTVPCTIGWDKKSEVYFECDNVFPCTITLVVLYLWVSEK